MDEKRQGWGFVGSLDVSSKGNWKEMTHTTVSSAVFQFTTILASNATRLGSNRLKVIQSSSALRDVQNFGEPITKWYNRLSNSCCVSSNLADCCCVMSIDRLILPIVWWCCRCRRWCVVWWKLNKGNHIDWCCLIRPNFQWTGVETWCQEWKFITNWLILLSRGCIELGNMGGSRQWCYSCGAIVVRRMKSRTHETVTEKVTRWMEWGNLVVRYFSQMKQNCLDSPTTISVVSLRDHPVFCGIYSNPEAYILFRNYLRYLTNCIGSSNW